MNNQTAEQTQADSLELNDLIARALIDTQWRHQRKQIAEHLAPIIQAAQHQGAPAEFAFQSMLNLGWSADAVVRSMIDQGPLYRKPPVSYGDTAALRRVYDVFGLGYNHHISVLLANVENTNRFSDLLHAVEREFFMVPGEPSDEPEDEGCEPDDVCLVNSWGSSQEQYLEQFRTALTTLADKRQGELQERQALTDRFLFELLKHGRLVGWEPVLISHLEEHLKTGVGADLSKFIQIVDDCYHLASSYSPCLDNVDEHGGDDHEDPTCAIFHRLYYAMFLVRKPATEAVNHA